LAYGDQAEANTGRPQKAPAGLSSTETHLRNYSDDIRRSAGSQWRLRRSEYAVVFRNPAQKHSKDTVVKERGLAG